MLQHGLVRILTIESYVQLSFCSLDRRGYIFRSRVRTPTRHEKRVRLRIHTRVAATALLTVSLVATGLALAPTSTRAQDPVADPPAREAVAPDSASAPRRHSAGGAFLRSVLIPGWGQAKVGSPDRGGFYFAVESMSLWMILKTSKTLGSARDIVALRRAEAEARVIGEGTVVDPVEIANFVDEDEAVQDAEVLVELRSQQKEDWVAFGLFFLLLGGADAFVAAHLADFPVPLEAAIRPLPNTGVELAFSLPFDPFR